MAQSIAIRLLVLLAVVGSSFALDAKLTEPEKEACLNSAARFLSTTGVPSDVVNWLKEVPLKPLTIVEENPIFFSLEKSDPVVNKMPEGCDKLMEIARKMIDQLPCMWDGLSLMSVQRNNLRDIFLADENLTTLYIGVKACHAANLAQIKN